MFPLKTKKIIDLEELNSLQPGAIICDDKRENVLIKLPDGRWSQGDQTERSEFIISWYDELYFVCYV